MSPLENDHKHDGGEWPQIERRKSKSESVQVTLEDVWELLKDINDRLSKIEHQYGYMRSAFVQNDLGKPDYDGHRRAHAAMMKADAAMESYKQEGTKSFIKIVIGFLSGVFALGVVEWLRSQTK